MFEQIFGIALLALCFAIYPLACKGPNIREAKYVDFSKVFR